MIKLAGKIFIYGLMLFFITGVTCIIFAGFELIGSVYINILIDMGITSCLMIAFGGFIFIIAALVDWLRW